MYLEGRTDGHRARTRAEDEAINVFARNLHDLLMAAPAGLRERWASDRVLRTG
ncbi:hypothetical protein ACLB1E_08730 [Escherichia coli]